MTLVVMQPYFFPYLGYFQLMHAADKFVVYDDVNFIKGGWINRNRLLANGEASYFTVPLRGASSFRPIHQVEVDDSVPWRTRLLKTFRQTYGKAPHFADVFPLLEDVLTLEELAIAGFAVASLRAVVTYLGLKIDLVESSRIYENSHLHGVERVLDICRKEGARRYVNASGGRTLYSPESFAEHGIELRFLTPRPIAYGQFRPPFVPWLSMLDVLMFNEREVVRGYLNAYELQ